MDANGFLESLDRQWLACLQAMRDGLDVPPATLYRLEGQCEAAIALGLVDAATLQQRLDAHSEAILGELPQAPGGEGRIRLALKMVTAPVYPSSKA